MGFILRTILSWMPLAAAITILSVLVYAAVQQNYRQSLNDPQIQMAEDAAARIQAGASPMDVVPKERKIDSATSLAPWIAVYDYAGALVESSATLYGNPPKGVFDATDPFGYEAKGGGPPGENRVTWQPREDVRQAIVVVRTQRYFVVAGRNMREVEDREGRLGLMILLAWLAAMGCSLMFTGIKVYFFGKMMGHGRS